jgi:hypothetical protein
VNVNDLGAVLGSPPAHDQGPGLNSGGELRFPGRGGLDLGWLRSSGRCPIVHSSHRLRPRHALRSPAPDLRDGVQGKGGFRFGEVLSAIGQGIYEIAFIEKTKPKDCRSQRFDRRW